MHATHTLSLSAVYLLFLEQVKQNNINSQYVWPIAEFVSSICWS